MRGVCVRECIVILVIISLGFLVKGTIVFLLSLEPALIRSDLITKRSL